jgi:hypothetical protein
MDLKIKRSLHPHWYIMSLLTFVLEVSEVLNLMLSIGHTEALTTNY